MENELPWVSIGDIASKPGLWTEIGYEQYQQAIECVPPRAGGYGYCLCGEPYSMTTEGTPLYEAVREYQGKYYARIMTFFEFNKERGAALQTEYQTEEVTINV